MFHIVIVLLFAMFLPPLQAQTSATERKATMVEVPSVFTFEEEPAGRTPVGWDGGPANTISVDATVSHSGQKSLLLRRDSGSASSFSVISRKIPLTYSGNFLELRGFLRTENVSSFAGLWMREDEDGAVVAFDNMQGRSLRGTTDWFEYSIKLPLRPRVQTLYIGVLISGTGEVWADDLQLLLDGKPIAEAPRSEQPLNTLDRDHQFDNGSLITVNDLTFIQIDNLVMLGKVWGFLKYYHPSVTAGQIHWDYELLRIVPAVLAAPDRAAAQVALSNWVGSIGPVKSCNPCVNLGMDGPDNPTEQTSRSTTEDQEISTESSSWLRTLNFVPTFSGSAMKHC
jgi:hypothetical protein